MNCPKCFEPLRIADRQGIEIDYCPDCRGVWLDRGELDKIIERTLSAEMRAPAYEEPPRHVSSRDHDHDKHYKKNHYKDPYKDHDKYYKKKHYKKKKAKHVLEELFDIFD